ncbi:MAG: hypothetical protein LBL71_03025 [Endomicrobium sp.]|jgi:hypothetical protein|nr:hypothetical protein [Endomicrobium sp.]
MNKKSNGETECKYLLLNIILPVLQTDLVKIRAVIKIFEEAGKQKQTAE